MEKVNWLLRAALLLLSASCSAPYVVDDCRVRPTPFDGALTFPHSIPPITINAPVWWKVDRARSSAGDRLHLASSGGLWHLAFFVRQKGTHEQFVSAFEAQSSKSGKWSRGSPSQLCFGDTAVSATRFHGVDAPLVTLVATVPGPCRNFRVLAIAPASSRRAWSELADILRGLKIERRLTSRCSWPPTAGRNRVW